MAAAHSRKEIFLGAREVNFLIDTIDLDVIRRAFSGLFDEACDAVTRAGLDLDDITVERELVCVGPGGGRFTLNSPPLADRDRLHSAICNAGEITSADELCGASIVKIQVRVFHEATEIRLYK